MELDYRQFEDKGWEDKVPLVEKTTSLLLDLGIYEGTSFLEWMREMLGLTGREDVQRPRAHPDEENLRYRYRLSVIASDVTNRRLLILPRTHRRSVSSRTSSRSRTRCACRCRSRSSSSPCDT